MSEMITTSTGIQVEVLCIPMALDAFRAGHKDGPKAPQYKVPSRVAKDGWAYFDLTQEIMDGDEGTPEERAEWQKEWAAYQKAKTAHSRQMAADLFQFIFLQGIRVEVMVTDEWLALQKACGMAVPEDPIERRLQYVKTRVCPTGEDLETIWLAFWRVNNATEEYLRQAQDSFRGLLGRQGHTARRDAEDRRQVASNAALRGSAGGDQDGARAQPV